MKKLFFLLSLLLLTVSTVKSQPRKHYTYFKVPVNVMNTYTYPLNMTYAEAYTKDSLFYPEHGVGLGENSFFIIDLKNEQVMLYVGGKLIFADPIVGVDMSGLNFVGVSTSSVNDKGEPNGMNIIVGQFPGSPYYFLQTEQIVDGKKLGHADQRVKPESVEFR